MTSLATTKRIAQQLRNDPRTIGLILVVPVLLLTLLFYVFDGSAATFDRIGPVMLAVLPMMLMFVVTSVVMLRERTSGTLERVLTTPLSRWNLTASYATVFGALAILQAALLGLVILWPMGVTITGSPAALFLLALLDALFGVAFGLMASAFAHSEFQAVQFMPLFVGPQLLLCGLLAPKDSMPDALRIVADCLPMTWAVDVVQDVQTSEALSSGSWVRIAGLAAVTILALIIASATMPRKTQ